MVEVTNDTIIEAVSEAQYDLQVALGHFRLMQRADIPERVHQPDLIEDRLSKSLARMHKLLDQLGRPMYQPATHPDV